jgi:prepilin signal peptidase PulO-like enzyme (type II secretory pathway)
MTKYEVLTLVIASISAIFAGLAFRRSGKGLSLQERQTIASEVALALTLRNAPSVSFRIKYYPDLLDAAALWLFSLITLATITSRSKILNFSSILISTQRQTLRKNSRVLR